MVGFKAALDFEDYLGEVKDEGSLTKNDISMLKRSKGWIWYSYSLIIIILLVLIMVQIITGEVLVFFDVIPLIQLFHLWIASWILGIISVQYCAWKRSGLIDE